MDFEPRIAGMCYFSAVPPPPPPPFRMEGVNFALRPHPISYRLKVHLAGWELVHHTCWEWGTCRCWREIHSLSSGTIALFFLRYEMTVEGKLVLRMACALSSRLSSIQRNLKIRALHVGAYITLFTNFDVKYTGTRPVTYKS